MSRTKIELAVPVLKSGIHYINSSFGPRTVNGVEGFHNGCDFVSGTDSAAATDYVIAFESGVVTHATNDVEGRTPSEGNSVYINHGNGIYSYYFHLKRGSVAVKKGDLVSRGDVIGYMGNTGNSYGAHLHFGLRRDGEWVDPLPYLTGDADAGFYRSVQNIRSMRKGNKGSDVKSLQLLLNAAAGESLVPDGSYGAGTESAVKRFQKSRGLTVDGIFGGACWREILSIGK